MMLRSSASWKKSASQNVLVYDLQREVVSIKICQDGFRNIKSNSISIFKMGFVASIKNNENSNELINIRLYKTWVDTDVLEPRQHLAWQRYIEEKTRMVWEMNLSQRFRFSPSPPYRRFRNSSCMPCPRQHYYPIANNQQDSKLESKEGIKHFDQARTCREDKHLLKVDYTPYDGDTDMEYMIKMLLSMASDPDMQYQMNIEDEYISLLERRIPKSSNWII